MTDDLLPPKKCLEASQGRQNVDSVDLTEQLIHGGVTNDLIAYTAGILFIDTVSTKSRHYVRVWLVDEPGSRMHCPGGA
jgi:hypothetical protein